MPSQKTVSNELIELFAPVNSEITWLNTIWEIYIQLYGTSNENMEIMNNTAPQFFGIIQYALFSELVTTINRLTDKKNTFGKRNASLEQIIEYIDHNKYPELIEKLNTKLQNINILTNPFRVWRDKKIAHSDLITALEQNAEILPGIIRKHAQNLINEIVDFINAFSVSYFDTKQVYTPFLIHSGDGIELMRILKKTIKNTSDQG